MLSREKHIKSGIRKIERYIKENRVRKLKKLYETFKESELEHIFVNEVSSPHGKRKKTYLHRSCSKGNSLMVETLLGYDVDIACCDANSNNILHFALNYVLETCDGEYFESTVLHLLELSTQEMIEQQNNYGESPEELLTEVMNLLNNKKKTFLLESDDEDAFDEKEWNEKLFFEMTSEGRYADESYAQEEHADTFRRTKKESFTEWGDRMRTEYDAKHNPTSKSVNRSRPRKHEEPTEEKVKYGPTLVDDLRKKLEMFDLREQYETKCKDVFSNKKDMLNFENIPWPISISSTEFEENIEKLLDKIIELFCYGFDVSDKLKYLRKQQVRWHPDRFQQKCGDRLVEKEKDDILKMVNSLSQRVNTTVDSII